MNWSLYIHSNITSCYVLSLHVMINMNWHNTSFWPQPMLICFFFLTHPGLTYNIESQWICVLWENKNSNFQLKWSSTYRNFYSSLLLISLISFIFFLWKSWCYLISSFFIFLLHLRLVQCKVWRTPSSHNWIFRIFIKLGFLKIYSWILLESFMYWNAFLTLSLPTENEVYRNKVYRSILAYLTHIRHL